MTEAEFTAAVRRALSETAAQLNDELAVRLRALPSRADAALLEFVVHPADLARDTCPIYAWEVTLDSRSSPWGGRERIQVLKSHKLLPPELDYFSPTWEEDIDEPGDIVIHEIACWFASAWAMAGGIEYCLPGFIKRHDALKFFSLNRRAWMDFPTDPQTGCLFREELK